MEQKKLTLSQIGLYNPQRLGDSTVESLFIVRTKLFQFLIEKLGKEKPGSIPQHYLIIGQRGMGKTTILKRIEVELRKPDYAKDFVPLLFPEEQYNMKNLAEFWLNSLDALADTLECEKHTAEVKQIDDKVTELQKVKNGEERAKHAFGFLKTFTDSLHRRPVLLVDNLNLIFDRMNDEEQHTLRALLMQNNSPVFIGASSGSIEGTYDYGASFYDAFQMYYLNKLDFEELLDILKNLALLTQEEDVTENIYKQIPRLKTLHQLTGGNPRTATMLFKIIIKGFSNDINDDLEALLDEITPLYKARFEELPAQMQVIVDAIALFWDPINLEQLRNETGYENSQLSPQLKRLAEAGWIEKTDAYRAKGSAYQVSERFFNIWFLMRRSSRRQKRELYCLSKFLECFYGEEINAIAQNSLSCKACSINHASYNLALADAVKDEELKNRLKEKTFSEIYDLANDNPDIIKSFEIPQEFLYNKINKSFDEILKEYESGNFNFVYNEIISLIKRWNSNSGIECRLYHLLGILFHKNLNKYSEAEVAYQKAIEFDEKFAPAWKSLGDLYKDIFKKYDKAEIAYKNAINLDDKSKYVWNNLGNLYSNFLNRFKDAEKAYNKAIEIDNKYAYPWNNLGNLYQNYLKKYEDAEAAYKKAIEIDVKFAYAWYGLGYLYQVYLKKFKESEIAYKRATEIDDKYASPWNGLGNLYQDYLKKYEEAEVAYKKVIEIDSNDIYAKLNLVFLYRDKMNKINEAEKLFNEIEINNEGEDSYWLNKTLFELYKRNEGSAKDYFGKALDKIQDCLPANTTDDWWRFGAIVHKLSYAGWLLKILEEKGYDIILSPFYTAIKALNEKDTEGYLNSRAVEIREPAKEIIEIMKKYQQ